MPTVQPPVVLANTKLVVNAIGIDAASQSASVRVISAPRDMPLTELLVLGQATANDLMAVSGVDCASWRVVVRRLVGCRDGSRIAIYGRNPSGRSLYDRVGSSSSAQSHSVMTLEKLIFDATDPDADDEVLDMCAALLTALPRDSAEFAPPLCPPPLFLWLLLQRYDVCPQPGRLDDATFDFDVRHPVQRKVLRLIKKWVSTHPADIACHPFLVETLEEFLTHNCVHSAARVEVQAAVGLAVTLGESSPPCLLPTVATTLDSETLLELYSAEEIARGMLHVACLLVRSIDVTTLADALRTHDPAPSTTSNTMLKLVAFFAAVQRWATLAIITGGSVVATKIADIAAELLSVAPKEKNCFRALLRCAQSPSVSRLRDGWTGSVCERMSAVFENQTYTDATPMFPEVWAALRGAWGEGAWQQGSVDVSALWDIYTIYEEINAYQCVLTAVPRFMVSNDLVAFFMYVTTISTVCDDDLWQASLAREPATQPKAVSRMLSSALLQGVEGKVERTLSRKTSGETETGESGGGAERKAVSSMLSLSLVRGAEDKVAGVRGTSGGQR